MTLLELEPKKIWTQDPKKMQPGSVDQSHQKLPGLGNMITDQIHFRQTNFLQHLPSQNTAANRKNDHASVCLNQFTNLLTDRESVRPKVSIFGNQAFSPNGSASLVVSENSNQVMVKKVMNKPSLDKFIQQYQERVKEAQESQSFFVRRKQHQKRSAGEQKNKYIQKLMEGALRARAGRLSHVRGFTELNLSSVERPELNGYFDTKNISSAINSSNSLGPSNDIVFT